MQLVDGLKGRASDIAPIAFALGYLFPVVVDGEVSVHKDGANWRVESAVEIHPAWVQDGRKYTLSLCHPPSLRTAAFSAGAKLIGKGYSVSAGKLKQLLSYFDKSIDIPDCLASRDFIVKQAHEGIELKVPFVEGDIVADWTRDGKNWTQLITVAIAPPRSFSDKVRHLRDGRWLILTKQGCWVESNAHGVKCVLMSYGLTRLEAEVCMGNLIFDQWYPVSRPFAKEYPSDREWNLGAPQLRYEPVAGTHPTWDMVLNHLGRDLDDAVREAAIPGIATGANYLTAWIAAIIANPQCRLPYLFFWSPEQDSGKSSFHESIELLVTHGVTKADRALTSRSDFNGELDGAIVCVVEETDLSKSSTAYAKIKDATTSLRLQIRRLYGQPYDIENNTHWVQTANAAGACPLEIGDSRIVSIRVSPLSKIVPKDLLQARLKEESPAFIYRLRNFQLPKPIGRLALPPLETASKRATIEANKPALARVVEELLMTADEWQGSASQLKAIDRECPGDFRTLGSAISKSELYLKAAGIGHDFPDERGLHGKQVRFFRLAA